MAIAHEWTWFHEYLGNQKLICTQDITQQEVIDYLNSLYTSSCFDKGSLRHRPVEIIDNQTRLLNIRGILNFGRGIDNKQNKELRKETVYAHARGSRAVWKTAESND